MLPGRVAQHTLIPAAGWAGLQQAGLASVVCCQRWSSGAGCAI